MNQEIKQTKLTLRTPTAASKLGAVTLRDSVSYIMINI